MDIVASSHGTADCLIIFVGADPAGPWLPIAHFTTNPNPDLIPFLKELWGNTPAGLKNTIVLSEDQLEVDRHGNRITASLTEKDVQRMYMGSWITVSISAFTMELNKVGGSIHTDYSITSLSYIIWT